MFSTAAWTMRVVAVSVSLFSAAVVQAAAFSPCAHHPSELALKGCRSTPRLSAIKLESDAIDGPSGFCPSRRAALLRSASALIGGLAAGSAAPQPSIAAAKSAYTQEASDKDKIARGYKRLDTLVENWDKMTTICGRSDNPYIGCERTPEKVMEYLGYKSMEDPLFRADKTLFRLQSLVGSDDAGEFQDAVDVFIEKAEEGNGLAFVSSWGEANPGGGKDRIELFIERSKKDVIECRDSLATVVKILDLKVN